MNYAAFLTLSFLATDQNPTDNYAYDIISKVGVAGLLFFAVRALYAQNRTLYDGRIASLEKQAEACNADRLELRAEISKLNEKMLGLLSSIAEQNRKRSEELESRHVKE